MTRARRARVLATPGSASSTKECIRALSDAGAYVVMATQMLESMIASPVPTRAEASDVATAIYEGAGAAMPTAESASGQFPVEPVTIMDSIIRELECESAWRLELNAGHASLARCAVSSQRLFFLSSNTIWKLHGLASRQLMGRSGRQIDCNGHGGV